MQQSLNIQISPQSKIDSSYPKSASGILRIILIVATCVYAILFRFIDLTILEIVDIAAKSGNVSYIASIFTGGVYDIATKLKTACIVCAALMSGLLFIVYILKLFRMFAFSDFGGCVKLIYIFISVAEIKLYLAMQVLSTIAIFIIFFSTVANTVSKIATDGKLGFDPRLLFAVMALHGFIFLFRLIMICTDCSCCGSKVVVAQTYTHPAGAYDLRPMPVYSQMVPAVGQPVGQPVVQPILQPIRQPIRQPVGESEGQQYY